MNDTTEALTNTEKEDLYLQTTLKLRKESQKESKLYNVIYILLFVLVFAQYYYFIGYTPIDGNDLVQFIEVPNFNPILGMLFYLISTIIAFIALPRKKHQIAQNYNLLARNQYTKNSTEAEILEYKSESTQIFKIQKSVFRTRYLMFFAFLTVVCTNLSLSYYLHHHVEINNKLGAEVSSISSLEDQIKLIDHKVANGQIDPILKGYYINQLLYIELESQINSSSQTQLGFDSQPSERSTSLAKHILEGYRPKVAINPQLYIENMKLWTDTNNSGLFKKSSKSNMNGKFLHNQEPLIILGNYLKNHQSI